MAFAATEQIMMRMKVMKKTITVKGREKAKEVVSYLIMFAHRFSFSVKRKTLTCLRVVGQLFFGRSHLRKK